jgi:protein ImuB
VGRRVAEALGGTRAVQVGVADGPFAALLAARRPRRPRWPSAECAPVVVPPDESPAFLAPLPITSLGRPDLTDVLVRLGLRTLGAFAAVPAGDVVGRFGAEGERAHRLARGLDERPPDTRVPPPDLRVTAELDPPAERVEQVAFVARDLADELFARLGHLGLGCTRVAVTAETEHGERCERLWRHEGTLDAGAIADRVRWQVDSWLNCSALGSTAHPTAGVTHLALAPDEVVPAHGRQLSFWGGESEAAERATRVLARVEGLLGPEAVLVPEWRGGRAPGEQVTLVPASAVDLAASRPATDRRWIDAPWPGQVPGPAPATLHRRPVPVEMLDTEQRPVEVSGRGVPSAAPAELVLEGSSLRLSSWAGPWPADERWWDGRRQRRRARFQVVTADGVARLVVLEGGRWWLEATYD